MRLIYQQSCAFLELLLVNWEQGGYIAARIRRQPHKLNEIDEFSFNNRTRDGAVW